jgi:hypothetical protein
MEEEPGMSSKCQPRKIMAPSISTLVKSDTTLKLTVILSRFKGDYRQGMGGMW